jgi:hypothetical protein
MTWERRDGIVQQVPAIERHVFNDLTTRVTLGAGEYLLIGAGDAVDEKYLFGSRFLTRQHGGKRLEWLLFLTPQGVEIQGSGRPPT